ncbi:hypothetical protein OG885_00545 [Streptomyces sp. NBC_00028]
MTPAGAGLQGAPVEPVVTLSVVFLPLGLAKIAALPFMRRATAHLGAML